MARCTPVMLDRWDVTFELRAGGTETIVMNNYLSIGCGTRTQCIAVLISAPL